MLKFLAPAIVIAIAACSQPQSGSSTQPATSTSAAQTDMGSMAMGTSATTATHAGPIRATGTVTQVDAAAGTITFSHGAIPAVNWPAMTMQFHAENPAILQDIAVGDHVSFELKSASEPQVVTIVQKQ